MEEDNTPKKVSKLKTRLSFIFAFLVVFSIITFLLPTWVSTPSGKKWATNLASKYLNGNVKIDSVSLSWFGEQSLKNLHFVSSNKLHEGHVKEFHSSMPLWKILFKDRDNDQLTIIEPRAIYRPPPKTTSANLSKAKISDYMPLLRFKILDLLSEMNIVGARAEFILPDSPSLILSNTEISYLKHEGESPKSFLKAETLVSFGDRKGKIKANFNLSNLFFIDIDTIVRENSKIFGISNNSEIATRFDGENLPVEGFSLWVNAFLGKDSFLHDFLGNELGSEISFVAKNKEVSLDIALDSSNTQARLFGSLHKGYFTLNIPATIEQKLSKQVFKDLLGDNWNLSISSY